MDFRGDFCDVYWIATQILKKWSYSILNRGKKRIRKGQKVEFRVVSQEGGKYRAVEINLVWMWGQLNIL